MNYKWYVEGWKGLDCVGWFYVVYTASLPARANRLVLDMHADRVYVRPTDSSRQRFGFAAAYFANGRWTVVDPKLEMLKGE